MASITTDTGDFAPSSVLGKHHNTAQLCIAATQNTEWLDRRTTEGQLAAIEQRSRPLADSLTSRAFAVARQCLAQLKTQNALARDLPDLFRLALLAGEDTLAATFAERWLQSRPTPAARDTTLLVINTFYLSARPARPMAGAHLLDRVSTTGEEGDWWRAQLGVQLVNFWANAFDETQIRRWANDVIATIRHMSSSRRPGRMVAVAQAYQALGKVAYLRYPDSLVTLAEQARQDWVRLPFDSLYSITTFNPATAPVEDIARYLIPIPEQLGATPGKLYPALTAQHWFPAPLTTAPAVAATLVISPNARCFTEVYQLIMSPAQECYPTYERIRLLAKQYGSDLRIVFLAGTQGHAIRSLPLTRAQEVEELRRYVMDYLKLPVTLAIVERPLFELPMPDGRRWPKPLCMGPMNAYWGDDSSAVACHYLSKPVVLLARRGELVFAGDDAPYFDLLLQRTMLQAPRRTGEE